MKLTLEESSESSITELPVFPEETVVPATIVQVDVKTNTRQDGGTWDSLNFKFNIDNVPSHLGSEYEALINTPLWGSVSAYLTTHPDNKLRAWAEAALAIGELGAGFDLDTDDLIGLPVRVVTRTYERKKDSALRHAVGSVLPAADARVSTLDDEPPF